MEPKKIGRRWPPRRPKQAPTSNWFFAGLKEETRKKVVVGLVGLLIMIITAVGMVVFINLGGGTVLRKYNLLKTEAETTHFVNFSGILYQLEGQQETPLANVNVAIKGVDDFATLTNSDGSFFMKVRLPVTVKEVKLRFFDQYNNLIHEETAAVVLNETGVSAPIRYVIPIAKSVFSI